MATKKDKKDAKPAAAPVKEKKVMSAEEKAAKRAARMEALKNRPAVQRTNSKQIDVIELEKGKVLNYGYAIRKTGTLVTSVALDEKGNVVSTSVTFISGTKVKVKKNHGNILPGLSGEGKKGKGSDDTEEVEGDSEDEEDEEDED